MAPYLLPSQVKSRGFLSTPEPSLSSLPLLTCSYPIHSIRSMYRLVQTLGSMANGQHGAQVYYLLLSNAQGEK
jgi:hypothetical protein